MALSNAVNATSTGLQSLTSAGVFNGRTITGTSNQVAVANGDGISGNPTISLTSTIYTNISFDSGSNTLANYATGTFSPTITNTGSAPTLTYSTQIGRYTRIGNRILGIVNVVLTSYAAGTGNTQLANLPFTSQSTTNNININPIILGTVTFGLLVLWYVSSISPNVTVMDFMGNRSANTSLNLAAAGPTATSNFIGELDFEV